MPGMVGLRGETGPMGGQGMKVSNHTLGVVISICCCSLMVAGRNNVLVLTPPLKNSSDFVTDTCTAKKSVNAIVTCTINIKQLV